MKISFTSVKSKNLRQSKSLFACSVAYFLLPRDFTFGLAVKKGKSSFINKMAGRNRAKVADKAGVTRQNQWFVIDNGINEVLFINYVFAPSNKTYMNALTNIVNKPTAAEAEAEAAEEAAAAETPQG